MKQNIQDNSILQDNQQTLLVLEESSDIVKYHSLGIQTTKDAIWMPGAQKSIFLTAVQVSAPLAVSILLSDGNNNFLALRVTEPFSTISQYFTSACKLQTNNPLMISTSDEEIKCNNFGATTVTQVDYNGRSDFTNVNNAIGLANGSVATLISGLLTQTRGRIVLGYNMLPSEYDYLEIKKVVIKYYCSLNLTLAVGVSSMIFNWRPNPLENWIQLDQINLSILGTINHLIAPLAYDITNTVLQSADPWQVISNLQTSFVGSHTGLGLGNAIQLDAVEIEVCLHGKNQVTLFGYEA